MGCDSALSILLSSLVDFVPLENPLVLHSDIIKSLIKETVFATAQTEKKPILAGVNFAHNGGNLIVTATDSFRLSQKVTSIAEYSDFNLTIPNNIAPKIGNILEVFISHSSEDKFGIGKVTISIQITYI